MSVLAERASSPSPSRRISIGSKISAFGAKLNRTLSGQTYTGDEAVSPIIPKSDKDRSASRGREAFTSTGRGGIGNIRQASQSRDARPDSGPDDFSVTRGREALSKPQNLYSTGRGGAGNIRSPSRDVGTSPKIDEEERKVIDEYVANQGSAPVSTGRGGLGNINRSRSRDPSVTRNVFSTGRGGAGNIHPGDGAIAESVDEQERRKYSTTNDGYHSTGRGGLANITDVPKPPVEVVHPTNTHISSTGRGGAGNIYTK